MGTAIFNGNEPWPSSMDISVEFAAKIAKGEMKVGIIGLGYVGLPTAIGFHDAGFEVWGVDVSQRTVDMVMAGKTQPATRTLTTSSLRLVPNAGTSPPPPPRRFLTVMWSSLPCPRRSRTI